MNGVLTIQTSLFLLLVTLGVLCSIGAVVVTRSGIVRRGLEKEHKARATGWRESYDKGAPDARPLRGRRASTRARNKLGRLRGQEGYAKVKAGDLPRYREGYEEGRQAGLREAVVQVYTGKQLRVNRGFLTSTFVLETDCLVVVNGTLRYIGIDTAGIKTDELKRRIQELMKRGSTAAAAAHPFLGAVAAVSG
jgi:hypothetical protein